MNKNNNVSQYGENGFPLTPTSKVDYMATTFGPNREPVKPYLTSTVIDTPKSNPDLQVKMLAHHVALSQVKNVWPIQPRQELHRPHPALKAFVKYASQS